MQQVLLNIHYASGGVDVGLSYAAAVGGSLSPFLLPTCARKVYVIRDPFSIQLNAKSFEERLTFCRRSLIARVVFSKGESPWKLVDLKDNLPSAWDLPTWKLISLGKGFYHVLLHIEVIRIKFRLNVLFC